MKRPAHYGRRPWDGISIYAEEVVEDATSLAAMLDDPAIDKIDRTAEQAATMSKLVPRPGQVLVDEPYRWVYYPWRRTAVRVLGPRAFRRVRLDRNRNKITQEEQAHFDALSVGVVGLSVGATIAYTLAMEGLCGSLRLADFDELDLSNLNRVPATLLDIGLNKAVIAARRIVEIDPYISVQVMTDGVGDSTMDEFFDGLHVVVEECDSLDMKLAIRSAARENRIPLIMETSDRGLIDVERYDIDPSRPLIHGLLGDLDPAVLAGLSDRDKVPFVMRIMDAAGLSPRLAASLVEVDETISTWPRTAEDVQLGSATVAAAVRMIGRRENLSSGRARIDIDGVLSNMSQPELVGDANIDEEDEPVSSPSTVGAVLDAVQRAPSGGNSQPWTASVTNSELVIDLDPTKTSDMDIGFRGSAVAVGAAMFNARVAAAAFAALGTTRWEVYDHPPYLRATMKMADGIDDGLAGQFEGVLRRETSRHLGSGAELTSEDRTCLRAVRLAEGVGFDLLVDRESIDNVGEILAEGDRIRYLTPILHEQMFSELRWPDRDDLDTGIDVRSLELDRTDLAKLDVARREDIMALLREWGGGRALGDDTRDRMKSSSALGIVSVNGSALLDFARAGSDIQRLWVAAERTGLTVQPMSPPFLYALNRSELADEGDFGDTLWRLRQSLCETAGIDAGRSLALLMRFSYAKRGSVRSRRAPAIRAAT